MSRAHIAEPMGPIQTPRVDLFLHATNIIQPERTEFSHYVELVYFKPNEREKTFICVPFLISSSERTSTGFRQVLNTVSVKQTDTQKPL